MWDSLGNSFVHKPSELFGIWWLSWLKSKILILFLYIWSLLLYNTYCCDLYLVYIYRAHCDCITVNKLVWNNWNPFTNSVIVYSVSLMWWYLNYCKLYILVKCLFRLHILSLHSKFLIMTSSKFELDVFNG